MRRLAWRCVPSECILVHHSCQRCTAALRSSHLANTAGAAAGATRSSCSRFGLARAGTAADAPSDSTAAPAPRHEVAGTVARAAGLLCVEQVAAHPVQVLLTRGPQPVDPAAGGCGRHAWHAWWDGGMVEVSDGKGELLGGLLPAGSRVGSLGLAGGWVGGWVGCIMVHGQGLVCYCGVQPEQSGVRSGRSLRAGGS